MDRNVVTATILIALIMFGWLWWFAPEPPGPDDVVGVDTVAVDPELDEAPPEEASGPAAVTDSLLAGALQGEEQYVTVATDLYTARFSTKGATPVSFELREYSRFDQETPVELVQAQENGALGLIFTTPNNHVVDSRSLYFRTPFVGDTLRVLDAPQELVFEARVGEGFIRQIYTFQPGEYEVGLQVEQANAASFATQEGYELVWNGGIPFTENNIEQEAQAAGAFASSGGEVEKVTLDGQAVEEKSLRGSVEWVAVKNKYFTAALVPAENADGAELFGEQIGPAEALTGEDYTVSLLMSPAAEHAFRLYLGPMEYYRVTDYGAGLYEMVDYGWDLAEVITRPLAKYVFIPVFTFLSSFIANYGIIIILFAFLMKLVLYPLTKSSYTNMARMRELQPKMEAIKEKYGDDPQKQQEAMMKMYREAGINPLGGCLPMLAQWPVLIALWQFFQHSIELRQEGFLWAEDLSAPDVILDLPFTIPFYGGYVAGFTLLMGISMVIQMRVQMQPTANNAQAKIMTYLFPIMIFLFFNSLPSGLSLYYLVFNVLTAVQQKFINQSLEQKGLSAPADKPQPGGANAKKAKKRPRGGTDGEARTSKRVRT